MTTRQKWAAWIVGTYLFIGIAVLIVWAQSYQEQKQDLIFIGTTKCYLSDDQMATLFSNGSATRPIRSRGPWSRTCST